MYMLIKQQRLPCLKELDLSGSWNFIETPDFNGLPLLEILNLHDCYDLREIHPSIGYHENLVSIDLGMCAQLESFPPIVRLEKLETLVLPVDCKLREFQESSDSLARIRGCNFQPLKSLKSLIKLDLEGCVKLETPPEFLVKYDEPYLLLPRWFKLSGRVCNFVDRHIPPHFNELSNLQVLNLGNNNFSRLCCGLSLLSGLKYLSLRDCKWLVELPSLPSSIAMVEADGCSSLEIIADLPTHCDWLWLASFLDCPKLVTNEQYPVAMREVLKLMLQGNAIGNHIFYLAYDASEIPSGFVASMVEGNTFTLTFPLNWYKDFIGFSFCIVCESFIYDNKRTVMGYVPFCALKDTMWWNSTCDMFLLSITCEMLFKAYDRPVIHDRWARWLVDGCGFELVSRTNDSAEITKTEFFDQYFPRLRDENICEASDCLKICFGQVELHLRTLQMDQPGSL